jgi:hypothetical protein
MSKYTLEQRSEKYDELYSRASKILEEFNPCKIENGTCIQFRLNGENFCCDECSNLSEKGCTVQSLYCKTWLCETAAKDMGENIRNLMDLCNRLMMRRGSIICMYFV